MDMLVKNTRSKGQNDLACNINIGNKNAQQGVAMLEVMIAIFVVALGFMALIKLQMDTLVNVGESHRRYVAAYLAQDMGERIRANSLNIAAYSDDSCGGICATDYAEWDAALADARNALPGGEGTVSIGASVATITVSWDERRVLQDNGKASFVMEVPIYVTK